MRWVGTAEITKEYRISRTTLKRWRDGNHIKWKQISERKILYGIAENARDRLEIPAHVVALISHDGRRGERELIETAYCKDCIICDDRNGYAKFWKLVRDRYVHAVILSGNIYDYENPGNVIKAVKRAMFFNMDIWILNKEEMCLEEYKEIGMLNRSKHTDAECMAHEFGNNEEENDFEGKKIIMVNETEISMATRIARFDAEDIMGLNEEQTEKYKAFCEMNYVILLPK